MMINRVYPLRQALVAVVVLLLCACAQTADIDKPSQSNQTTTVKQDAAPGKKSETKQKVDLNKNPSSAKKDGLPASIAILPFNNLTTQETAPAILRYTLFGHLAGSNYRFSHLKDVDNRLVILNPETTLQFDDAGMLSDLLGVEGLLYVDVLSYDKIYAGIYAQISFEVRVTLVDSSGKVLWQEEFDEVSREGGISANALAMLYNIAMTAMHLSDENILAVADKLGRKIAKAFPQPKHYRSSNASFIETVLHNGILKPLRYSESIEVGIKGEANKIASVSIEGINQVFPLQEKEPGIYMGLINVEHGWNGTNLMLTGQLVDSTGAVSKYVSSVGLLNFDNSPPQAVNITRHKIDGETVTLEWQSEETDLEYAIYQISGSQRQLIAQTSQATYSWPHSLKLFENLNIVIAVKDSAGNSGPESVYNTVVYPVPSMYRATAWQQSRLPQTIEGQVILRHQDGPFMVDQKVVLLAGSSLYIEPDTEITFTNAGNLTVQGSLFTFGQNSIKMRPLSSVVTGQTFLSLDSTEHVEIDGLHISDAGIGIEVLKGKPVIKQCQIMNSQYSAMSLQNNAMMVINNCEFSGSNTSAIVVADQARLSISSSRFTNNFPFHIQNSSIYEVQALGNLWHPDASDISVLGKVRY